MLSRKFIWALLPLVAAVILFANIGAIPLLDPDEPVYAETAREMLQFDEYVSPRIYGEYWYDKPPMYYWLVAAAYQVFGVGEFAARFPSALLGVVCVLLVFAGGGSLLGRRAGAISAFVLATSIEFFYLGKAAVTDIALTLFLTASLLAFIRKKYYWFYACAGLAVLTKGPIGLFFPAVIGLLHLLLTRNLQELKQAKLLSGTALFLLIAVPWYAAMYQLHGGAFIETFLGFHNITRFTSPEHPTGVLWYYYLPVLLIGFFPWITVLFQALFHAFARPRGKFEELLFLTIWAAAVFLFFTVSQTKLVSYILPMFPALAMLVGWYIDHAWSDWHNTGRQYIWGALTALLFALCGAGSYMGLQAMPALAAGVYALIGVLAVTLLAVLAFLWRRKIGWAFGANVVGMTLTALVISYLLFPAAAPDFAAKRTAAEFQKLYDGRSLVYVSKFLRPGFAFYSGHYGKELNFSQTQLPEMEKVVALPGKAYFVLRTMDYNRIAEPQRQKLHILREIDNKVLLMKAK